MKKILQLGSLFLLSCAAVEARCPFSNQTPELIDHVEASSQNSPPHTHSHVGTSGFGNVSPDHWYTITTNSYPEVTLLSQQQNMGISSGGIYVSPTGFTVSEAGDYWITVMAVLQNPGDETLLIPVFLVKNETFNPDETLVGSIVTLEPHIITSVQGTGIVRGIKADTRLSLVATNGGYSLPQDITVGAWSISLFKLP